MKKSRKALIIILAIVLALALTVFFLFYSTEEDRVKTASINTLWELYHHLDGCDDMLDFGETMFKLADHGAFTLDGDAVFSGIFVPGIGSENEADKEHKAYYPLTCDSGIHFDYDHKGQIMAGSLDLGLCADGCDIPLYGEFSATDKQVLLAFPEVLPEMYSATPQTMGYDFIKSSLYNAVDIDFLSKSQFNKISLHPFIEFTDEELAKKVDKLEAKHDAFWETVDVEKTESTIHSFDGTVYTLTYDRDALNAMLSELVVFVVNMGEDTLKWEGIHDILEDIHTADVDILVGVKDNMLTAATMRINGGETVEVVFCGAKKTTDEFRVYVDGEDYMNCTFDASSTGLEITLNCRDFDTMTLKIDDSANKAYYTAKGIAGEMDYGVTGKFVDCTVRVNVTRAAGDYVKNIFVYDDHVFNGTFKLGMGPLAGQIKTLGTADEGLFSMTISEYLDMLEIIDRDFLDNQGITEIFGHKVHILD